MTREFKFRFWDEEMKSYWDWEEIQNDWESDGYFDTAFRQDHWKCEQFTGLYDRNGKEIYEGDILGYKDYADKRVVVWDNKYMAYRVHDEDNVDCGSCYQEYVGEFGIEVIGNIHKNPELLKESK